MQPTLAASNVRRQNDHPIKVLTSGREEVADAPFWAGGRWRFERRERWWETYDGPMVVIGHYWRARYPRTHQAKGPDLFAGVPAEAVLGRGRVICVDYAIGKRADERRAKVASFETALAAYRTPPEGAMDTGTVVFAPDA